MVKTWKTNGDEDRHVLKLIKEGKVTKTTTALDLKNTYPEKYGEFSSAVIRNHLNVLKKAKGIQRKLLFGYLQIFELVGCRKG
jgi:hypothetical protein